jgi:hypothetical protein
LLRLDYKPWLSEAGAECGEGVDRGSRAGRIRLTSAPDSRMKTLNPGIDRFYPKAFEK